jgi:sigma-B regulation protein RsbU (phosphoserine phosphatase)
VTEEKSAQLSPGDLMVLFTDGVIEAMNEEGEQFGPDRLYRLIQENRETPPYRIRHAIMEALRAWATDFDDDVTLVVIRCQGVYWDS